MLSERNGWFTPHPLHAWGAIVHYLVVLLGLSMCGNHIELYPFFIICSNPNDLCLLMATILEIKTREWLWRIGERKECVQIRCLELILKSLVL